MNKKTIVIVGAGKGCGNHVARKFGKEGFRVILMSRNLEHLKQYEEEFKAQNIEVDTQTVDASNLNSITQAFNSVKAKWGVPDVLFYNVGVTTADADLTEPKDAALLLQRYQVDVAGAYHAIQQVVGPEFSQKKGAILVTGGGLGLYPMEEYLPLSMDKAALRAMCIALHNKLKEQNVYVGILTVTDSIKQGGKCDPTLLAEDFWKLYTLRETCELVR